MEQTPHYEQFGDTAKVVKHKIGLLNQSDRSFSALYRIGFEKPNFVMAETSSSFGGIRRYTYGEAGELIGRLAAGLRKQGFSDRYIALYGDNAPSWLFLFWAVLRSGNKPFMVNLRQPFSFNQSMIDTLDCACIVTNGVCEGYRQPVWTYDALLTEGEHADLPAPDCFADEIALCTSGTTLQEKICFYTGKEFSALLQTTEEIIRRNKTVKRPYHGGVKMLVVLPLYHIFGLEATYFWFSFFGCSFVFPESMNPEILLRTIREHEVTHILCVPALWHTVEKLVRREVAKRGEKTRRKFEKGLNLSLKLQSVFPFTEQRIPAKLFREVRESLFGESVHFCISGGSAIRRSALELMNGIGYPLFNGYGMTEIGIASANFARRAVERLNSSFGTPFSCVRFRIDERKHLLVSGKSVCRRMLVNGRYVQMDEWFDTGDITETDEKGRYVLCGRASDVVLGDGGENLNPELAEQCFTLSSAKNFCVLGDERKEHLELICQVSPDMVSVQKEKLDKDLKEGLSKLPLTYRISHIYYTTDPIMDETDIKVSRSKLRSKIQNGEVRLTEDMPASEQTPGNGEESDIAAILRGLFSEILDVPPESIDPNAHFMNDLGASSLEYIMLVSRIQERFDVNVAFEEGQFDYSLNAFAKLIEELICL